MAPRIRVPANFGTEHINSPAHGNLLLKLKEGHEIRTNSMIMSLNSPVIDNLTTNLFQSCLELDDFTVPAVNCFVEALYSGEPDRLQKDIFEEVNKMAHVFHVSWLTKRCLKFYETDVLKFENSSYKEILFAFEIASRAHYNLKQSKYVSCFVRNVTFSGIGKSVFVQRYLAGFIDVPQRRIDMALAVAANDLNIIGGYLVTYLSLTHKRKEFDENSLYMLRKLDVQKFSRTFPSQFSELTNFLTDISKESECAEVKTIVENFAKSIGASSSSTVQEVENDVIIEDLEDSDYDDCKDVANQTDEIQSGWIQPVCITLYSLLPDEPVQSITTDNVLRKRIGVFYTPSGEGRIDERSFAMRCENIHTSQWSYYIDGCTVYSWNTQYLNNVPPEKAKHWIITKTSTHLKVVCNKVTVLNFNFATDYTPGNENGHQIWVKRCTAVGFYTWDKYDNLLLLNTGS